MISLLAPSNLMDGHDPFLLRKYTSDACANPEIIHFFVLFLIFVNCAPSEQSGNPVQVQYPADDFRRW